MGTTSGSWNSKPNERAAFQTTQWTAVLAAADISSTEAAPALAHLCSTYWYPLYTYARRLGKNPEQAQDLVQGFFAKLLEKEFIKAADPEKGRFRTFLLVALQRYVANEWKREQCQKRGGGVVILPLEPEETETRYQAEPKDTMTPERAFDRRWAQTLLAKVMDRLRADYARTGRAAVFEALEGSLSGDNVGRSLAEIGEGQGMTEAAVKVAVHRLRRRYRELLRQEIAETVADPGVVDDEICELFAALE